MMVDLQNVSLETALQLDQADPLAKFRDEFCFPECEGKPDLYLVGNSLGLMPKRTQQYVNEVLESWGTLGVRGHFTGDHSWLAYHEYLTETMAGLVGGNADEVIVMNSLTVNLHLMMCTFYRPSGKRRKILIEEHAFPSDKQAAFSQIRHHGLHPDECLIEVAPDEKQQFPIERIADAIHEHKDELALILLPGVQYYTGQVFAMKAIAELGRQYEIPVGLDLAHAAGNVVMKLHEWGVDFACWCTYKYLNSGPGSLGGCFVHRRHATNVDLPRLSGWWGHDKESRFKMTGEFSPIPTAEGWQLSNPPILSAAAIRASLSVFAEAGGIERLWTKSRLQSQFFRGCLENLLGNQVNIISDHNHSGCQLSLEIQLDGQDGKSIYERLEEAGVRTDWREPNVIRAAPVPLYNSFQDIWKFVKTLADCLA